MRNIWSVHDSKSSPSLPHNFGFFSTFLFWRGGSGHDKMKKRQTSDWSKEKGASIEGGAGLSRKREKFEDVIR